MWGRADGKRKRYGTVQDETWCAAPAGRPHDLLSVEQSQLRGKQLAWAARRPCWHGYCGCGKVVPDGTRQPPIRRDDQTQSGFMKKVNRRPNWSVTGQGVFQRRCRPRTGALPWIRLGGSAVGRAGERRFCDGLLSSIEVIKISACCYFTTSLTRQVVKMLQARTRSNNGSTIEFNRSPLFVRDHLFDRLKVFGTFTTTWTRQKSCKWRIRNKTFASEEIIFFEKRIS